MGCHTFTNSQNDHAIERGNRSAPPRRAARYLTTLAMSNFPVRDAGEQANHVHGTACMGRLNYSLGAKSPEKKMKGRETSNETSN